MKILILNGPNLNRLGLRKPEVYGSKSMAQILLEIQRNWLDVHFVYKQSNHEGDLIDWIQEANDKGQISNDQYAGIVLNAGGYSHTSVALRDAEALLDREVVDNLLGYLGTISEVMVGPANDVWVIDGPFGEVLVPVVDEVVVEVPDAGPIIVSVPSGLVDGDDVE